MNQKSISIRVIGIYIVIILAIVRFLIYPLQDTLREKKILLNEWYETYRIKAEAHGRQERDQRKMDILDRSLLFPHLYDKEVPISLIHSDILEQAIELAEKRGMTIINFEMLTPMIGKGWSEVPILIRFKGQMVPFIETLEVLQNSEKLLNVRSMEISASGQEQVFLLTLSAFRLER